MARLIADGPGYGYLKSNCAKQPYTVCKFLDRLPIPADTFLWSTNAKEGVFSATDLNTRRSLSNEQIRFAIDTLFSDPLGVISSAIRNSARQFLMVGVSDLFPDQETLQGLKETLPPSYYSALLNSRLVFRGWLSHLLSGWFTAVYFISTVSLTVTLVALLLYRDKSKFTSANIQKWIYLLSISLAALIINAAICGALSQPTARYQARIAWIPFFIMSLMVATYWKAISPFDNGRRLLRQTFQRRQASLCIIRMQSASYAALTSLILTLLPLVRRVTIVMVAVVGTLASNSGHRAMSFTPKAVLLR